MKLESTLLPALALRAQLEGGDVGAAREAFARHQTRVPWTSRVDTTFCLWRATQDRDYLAEAHRLLSFMRDHAPEQDRDSMIENVPLHRDIMQAWAGHGGD